MSFRDHVGPRCAGGCNVSSRAWDAETKVKEILARSAVPCRAMQNEEQRKSRAKPTLAGNEWNCGNAALHVGDLQSKSSGIQRNEVEDFMMRKEF
jgi:hypothetical protein